MEKTADDSLITSDNIGSAKEINQSEENQPIHRTIIERFFGPMKEGSLRGSIFTLLASAMGTGVFNLPLRAQIIGVYPFIVFVFLGGLFSMIGMILMIRLIRQNKYSSYSEMSYAAFGAPLKRISEFCNIIYPWGITICFQVIFAKFICQILYDVIGINEIYNNRNKEEYSYEGNLIRVGCNLGCLAFALIFALKKDISLLQKISLVGVISALFNIIVVIIISFVGFDRESATYHGITQIGKNHPGDDSEINWGPSRDGALACSDLAQGMASILFCYVNHQLLFPLCNSLKRPSKSRFNKIIYRVHVIEFIAYCSIGIVAYLLLIEHEKTFEIDPVVISSIPTVVVTIGKFLMLAALFFAVPLNLYPARESLFEALKLEKNNKNHVIVTLSMMFLSTSIAISFQKVNSYFGLLGGTAGVMMAGGIPSLCYIKLRPKLNWMDGLLLGMCFIITVAAVIGAVLSVF